MNLINLTISLRPDRLEASLPTIHARQLHSFTVGLTSVPDDVTSIVLRIFKTDLVTHFDIPVGRHPRGAGIAYAIGTCFPDVGAAKYEIHAYDARGNMTALGAGKVEVATFSTSGAPVTPGQPVYLTEIPDANGQMHRIVAVRNALGEYTTQMEN